MLLNTYWLSPLLDYKANIILECLLHIDSTLLSVKGAKAVPFQSCWGSDLGSEVGRVAPPPSQEIIYMVTSCHSQCSPPALPAVTQCGRAEWQIVVWASMVEGSAATCWAPAVAATILPFSHQSINKVKDKFGKICGRQNVRAHRVSLRKESQKDGQRSAHAPEDY